MRWKLKSLVAGAALAALATLAWAQTLVVTQSLSGAEVMKVQASPGGTEFYTTSAAIRNGALYQLVPTGGTVNTTVPANVGKMVVTGAITTWNLTLPASPFDGQILAVSCPGGTATTVVVAANSVPSGTTISGTAFTACTAGGTAANSAEFIYGLATNIWYRIS